MPRAPPRRFYISFNKRRCGLNSLVQQRIEAKFVCRRGEGTVRFCMEAVRKAKPEHGPRPPRARNLVLRCLSGILELSSNTVHDVERLLHRLRALRAVSGMASDHLLDERGYMDVVRPSANKENLMRIIFQLLARAPRTDRRALRDPWHDAVCVDMYEVVSLLAVASHGTVVEKATLLQEIFDTAQHCRSGVVFRPLTKFDQQSFSDDEMALLVVRYADDMACSYALTQLRRGLFSISVWSGGWRGSE